MTTRPSFRPRMPRDLAAALLCATALSGCNMMTRLSERARSTASTLLSRPTDRGRMM